MPILLNEEEGGKILVIRVSGKLSKLNYKIFVFKLKRLIRQRGTRRILFEMSNSLQWDAGKLWTDSICAIHPFYDIKKLAMVGNKTWRNVMEPFCTPFKNARIQYFNPSDVAAREWLKEE